MDHEFERKLDQTVAENHQSRNVRKRDHLWMLLLAVVPFAGATIWYLQTL